LYRLDDKKEELEVTASEARPIEKLEGRKEGVDILLGLFVLSEFRRGGFHAEAPTI
jgi:hypothetical protein